MENEFPLPPGFRRCDKPYMPDMDDAALAWSPTQGWGLVVVGEDMEDGYWIEPDTQGSK